MDANSDRYGPFGFLAKNYNVALISFLIFGNLIITGPHRHLRGSCPFINIIIYQSSIHDISYKWFKMFNIYAHVAFSVSINNHQYSCYCFCSPVVGGVCFGYVVAYVGWHICVDGRATQAEHISSKRPDKEPLRLSLFSWLIFSCRCFPPFIPHIMLPLLWSYISIGLDIATLHYCILIINQMFPFLKRSNKELPEMSSHI